MDDANLSKLSVDKPGLTPNFNKDILDYSITVPFDVESLKVKAVPSDRGASCSVKSDTGYGDQVKLNEGNNKILIEVSSEDGTNKNYLINCNRLSDSHALLNTLNFDKLSLKPEFEPGHFDYELCPSNNILNVDLQVSCYDSNCEIKIILHDKQLEKNSNGQYNLILNYTFTNLVIKVLSSNKSNEQTYLVKIEKSPTTRLCILDELDNDYQDCISLAPIFTPLNFKKTNVNYSKSIIDAIRNICSYDGLSLLSLSIQDSSSSINFDLENRVSNLKVKIPYLNGLYSKEAYLKDVFCLNEEISCVDKMVDLNELYKNFKSDKIKDFSDNFEKYQTRQWEKQLQIIYDETDFNELYTKSQQSFFDYLSVIRSEKSRKKINSNKSQSAIYLLNKSIFEAATAIKFDSTNFNFHFWLAELLEEKSFFENIYGPEEQIDTDSSLVLQNKIAEESSKEDEINAICNLRNVSATASNAQKLKALDMEYQHLKETNQHFKAEQVQKLYQYKAKKAINELKNEGNTNSYNNYIYQANMKYMDGLGIILGNKQENFSAFFKTGRSFFFIKDFNRALSFFIKCLNWSNSEFQTLSRFYVGYLLSKQTELDEKSAKLVLHSLCSGLELFLENLDKNLQNKQAVSWSENYYSLFNLEFLEAFLIIGKLQRSFKINLETIQYSYSFKYCAWLSCLALIEFNKRSKIDKEIFASSKLLQDIIVLLIEAHYNLATTNTPRTDKLKIKNLLNLVDLIRSLGNKENRNILNIQEEISEILVFNNIEEIYFLLLVACSKFELYDFLNDNKLESDLDRLNELLNDCKDVLTCSIQMFDKPLTDELKNLIKSKKWWQNLSKNTIENKKDEVKIEQNRPVSSTNFNSKDSKTPIQVKSNATVKSVIKKNSTQTPVKNISVGKPMAKTSHECKPQKNLSSNTIVDISKPSIQQISENVESHLINDKKIEININIDKNILLNQCHLYFGRVYSRLKQFDLAKEFYLKVIEKEPKKQESYIELASMLKKNNDLMGAVDVYSKYPLDLENNNRQNSGDSFDDAFICGELVSLLISMQNYDDPRLIKYLIIWAKIFGISIIEKYVSILDKANKVNACKQIYANVHNKSIDDPDLQQFFKIKGWI